MILKGHVDKINCLIRQRIEKETLEDFKVKEKLGLKQENTQMASYLG